jgi:hypothetical protein
MAQNPVRADRKKLAEGGVPKGARVAVEEDPRMYRMFMTVAAGTLMLGLSSMSAMMKCWA